MNELLKDLQIDSRNELEARFKYLNNNEKLNEDYFKKIQNYMSRKYIENRSLSFDIFVNNSNAYEKKRISIESERDIKTFLKGVVKKKSLIECLGSIENYNYLRKIKGKKTLNIYSFRIRCDKECKENLDFNEVRNPLSLKSYRYKKRYSYFLPEYDNLIRIDLTKVYQETNLNDIYKQFDIKYISNLKEIYEIEVEILHYNVLSEIILSVLANLQCLLYDSIQPFTNDEYYNVFSKWNKLINARNNHKLVSIGPNVVSMTYQYLFDLKKYSVTCKYDGIRKFAFFLNKKMYLLDKQMKMSCVFQFDYPEYNCDYTILDGELVDDIYYIFDVYFFRGKDIRNRSHMDRLSHLVNNFYLENLHKYLRIKEFLDSTPTNIHQILSNSQNNSLDISKSNIPFDGLIFTYKGPLINTNESIDDYSICSIDVKEFNLQNKFYNTGVIWKHIFKWKPKDVLSIDIYVDEVRYNYSDNNKDLYTVKLYTRNNDYTYVHHFYNNEFYVKDDNYLLKKYILKPFMEKTTHMLRLDKNRCLKNGQICEIIYDNDALESFSVDKDLDVIYWKFLRYRYDKEYPNLDYIANENLIYSIYPLTLDHLTDESFTQDGYQEYIQNINNLSEKFKETKSDTYRTKSANKKYLSDLAKFHQNIKSHIINIVVKNILIDNTIDTFTVLDLACGRFTDINIYKDLCSKMMYYIGIDISEDELVNNTSGAYKRLTSLPKHFSNKFLFLQGDVSYSIIESNCNTSYDYYNELYTLLKNKRSGDKNPLSHFSGSFLRKFSIVTIFFALHYFNDSVGNREKLHGLLNNVSSMLQTNGYFIGASFDLLKIQKLFYRYHGQEHYKEFIDFTDKTIQYVSEISTTVYFITSLNSNVSKISVFIESIGKEFIEYPIDFDEFTSICRTYQLIPCADKFYEELRSKSLLEKSSTIDFSFFDDFSLNTKLKEFSFCNSIFSFLKV